MARHIKSDVTFPADVGILYQAGLNPTVSLMEEAKKKMFTVSKNYGYLILDEYIETVWILICI